MFNDTTIVSPLVDNWESCDGLACPCSNHHIPSYEPIQLDTDGSIAGLEHLSRSNNVATPAEDQAIQEMLTNLRRRHDAVWHCFHRLTCLSHDLEAQTAHIDTQMEVLRVESDHLRTRMLERKHLLAPVRRLPSEILTLIFAYTIEFPVERSNETTGAAVAWKFHPKESALWTIELVCQRWRTEVLGAPSLWSHLDVMITDANFATDNYAYLQHLAEHLSRAGLSKLSICICDHGSTTFGGRMPTNLTTLLLPFSSRIRELYLMLPVEMAGGLAPLRRKLGALEKVFYLNSDFFDNEQIGPHDIKMFDMAPLLRTYETFDVDLPLDIFPVDWERILHYSSDHPYAPSRRHTTGGPTPNIVLKMLNTAPNLQTCSIRTEEPYHASNLVDVTCLHLSSLSMSAYPIARGAEGRQPIAQVFTHLTAPSLTRIVLHTSGESKGVIRDEPSTFRAITDCVERSRCPLSVFHYDNGNIAPEDLTTILRLCPTLTDLRLTNVGASSITNEVLQELFGQTSNSTPSPCLQTIHMSGNIQFDGDIFVAMVRFRWPVAPLREVNICWFVDSKPEGDDQIQEELERRFIWDELHMLEGLSLHTRVKYLNT